MADQDEELEKLLNNGKIDQDDENPDQTETASFEKRRALNQQILAGLSSKEQEMQDVTNPQRPLRAAALAALSGENPFTAANLAMKNRTDVAPSQIAHKLFERAEETGMPLRAPGQQEFPLEKPAGAIIGQLTDPGTLQGLAGGAAAGTIKPKSQYKQIAAAMTDGQRVLPAQIPRNKIVQALRESQAANPEVVQSKGLQDVNRPITGDEYTEKIFRLRAEKALKEAREAVQPETKAPSYFDLARKVKAK